VCGRGELFATGGGHEILGDLAGCGERAAAAFADHETVAFQLVDRGPQGGARDADFGAQRAFRRQDLARLPPLDELTEPILDLCSPRDHSPPSGQGGLAGRQVV